MGKVLEGRIYAQNILEDLKKQFKRHLPLGLVNLSFTNSLSSQVYIRQQKKISSLLGIDFMEVEAKSLEEALRVIEKFNQDSHIKGVIIQAPLPEGIEAGLLYQRLHPSKDIEGLTSYHLGSLFRGRPTVVSPTAQACFFLIKKSGISLYGKNAVLIGHSNIVGKPLAHLLLNEFCTVVICHIATFEKDNLQRFVEMADILCVSVGKANLIKGSWIKEGSLVIDVGINVLGGRIFGDVEFEGASKKAGFITPVPGGVGPLTCIFLFNNLLKLLEDGELQRQTIK